jgi:hypothetical protein
MESPGLINTGTDPEDWYFDGKIQMFTLLPKLKVLGSDMDDYTARAGFILSFVKKLLASFNNHEEACNMLCGKGLVRTQDLGYQSGA